MTPARPQTVPTGHRLVVFAEHQPEYIPLPAVLRRDDPEGRVVTEWDLTEQERIQLLAGGRIRLTLLTFNQPLQPILLDVVPVEATVGG